MKNKLNLILLSVVGLLLAASGVSYYALNLSQDKINPDSAADSPADNRSLFGMADQNNVSADNKSMPPNHDALMQAKLLKEQLQKNPADLEHWIQLGNILYDNGDFLGAIEPYEKALALDPANLNVRNDYAVCFFNAGQSGKAVNELEKIIAADADNISALYNLGVVHAHSGNKDLAEKYWKMVVARQPNSDMGQKAAKGLAGLNSF